MCLRRLQHIMRATLDNGDPTRDARWKQRTEAGGTLPSLPLRV